MTFVAILIKMKHYLFFLTLFLIVNFGSVQAQDYAVQEIVLKDGTLKSVIADYIISLKENNNEFSEMGYIEVEQFFYNRQAYGPELKEKYIIKNQNFQPNLSSSRFPNFYAFVENKIILFYYPNFSFAKHSKKSRKKLIKELQPFLNKKIHIIARDMDGNIVIDDKNFRDEYYNIHGGIQLKIFGNGKYEVKEGN